MAWRGMAWHGMVLDRLCYVMLILTCGKLRLVGMLYR